MIGRKLRLARAAAGLSLRDLVKAVDGTVSAQAISKYERDLDMPGSRALLALADALLVSDDYLLSGIDIALEGVEFRKKPTVSAKSEAALQAHAVSLMERYLALEDLLGLRSAAWEQPRSAPYPVGDMRDAEDAARSVRGEWGLGIDPIPNLAELLEERGIKVLSVETEEIDGLAAQVKRDGRHAAWMIAVRKDTWSERKRFSLAHELGHMVMRPSPDVDAEKAANRFASAFLMPADTIRAEVGSNRSTISIGELTALKLRFGASIQALTYRCKDLGIITQAEFKRLFDVFRERGWRDHPFQEPGSIPAEFEEPKRFERLCMRAYAEKVLVEARVVELLGTTRAELTRKLDQIVP